MRSFGLLTDKPQVVLLNATQGEEIPPSLLSLAPDALASTPSSSSSCRSSTPRNARSSWPTWGSPSSAATGSSARPTTRSASSPSSRPASPRSAAGTSSAAASAVDAAGKIHTDLAKGFIRAEVTAFDDLARLGTMKEVKAKNLQRLEGKDYVVKDGDVVYFRSGL